MISEVQTQQYSVLSRYRSNCVQVYYLSNLKQLSYSIIKLSLKYPLINDNINIQLKITTYPEQAEGIGPMTLQQPTVWQGATSDSKEIDESNPVIWHDDSRCAFLIE